MSHARTVIEPAEGLTVLVGPNNCGKSAVVAALQILCHNDTSTYVTRHNERECSVTIETDDGFVVQWRRRASPMYFVNGVEFSRLDRGVVPDKVQEAIRLPRVTADGNREFDVHFGEQKSPVFLLDKPGSHAAQFFASSSDAASLVEMQKRHQQKMLDARKERIRLEADAARLSGDLSILAAADQIGEHIDALETQHAALARLSSDISQIATDIAILKQAAGTLEQRNAEVGTLTPLRVPPVLEPTDPLAQVIDRLAGTAADLERQGSLADSLLLLHPSPDIASEEPLAALIKDLRSTERAYQRFDAECLAAKALQSPPQMEDVQVLDRVLRELVTVGQQATAMQGRAAALDTLAAPPALVSEAGLAEDLQLLRQAMAMLKRAAGVCDRLADLVPPAELADTSEMTQLVLAWEQARKTIDTHEQNAARAAEELQQAETTLRRWAQEQQICPTCGGVLDPARITEHARAHLGGLPHA